MWFEQHPYILALLPADAEITVFDVDSTLVADANTISSADTPPARVLQWGKRCQVLFMLPDGVRWC